MTQTSTVRNHRAAQLQGTPAGFVSRVAANAIDLGVIQVIFFMILIGIGVVRFLVNQSRFELPSPEPFVSLIGQWLIFVAYFTSNWTTTGRTIGKSVLGLRVIARDGSVPGSARAFGRALICATFYPALLWCLVSRDRSGLHDVAMRTRVVYDWTAHTPGED